MIAIKDGKGSSKTAGLVTHSIGDDVAHNQIIGRVKKNGEVRPLSVPNKISIDGISGIKRDVHVQLRNFGTQPIQFTATFLVPLKATETMVAGR